MNGDDGRVIQQLLDKLSQYPVDEVHEWVEGARGADGEQNEPDGTLSTAILARAWVRSAILTDGRIAFEGFIRACNLETVSITDKKVKLATMRQSIENMKEVVNTVALRKGEYLTHVGKLKDARKNGEMNRCHSFLKDEIFTVLQQIQRSVIWGEAEMTKLEVSLETEPVRNRMDVQTARAKVPPRDCLPTFTGKPQFFPNFKAVMQAEVFSKPEFSEELKLQILNRQLSDDIKEDIVSVLIGAGTAKEAMDILTEAYGRENINAGELQRELAMLTNKPCRNEELPKRLRRLRNIYAQLKAKNIDMNNAYFGAVFIRAMPVWVSEDATKEMNRREGEGLKYSIEEIFKSFDLNIRNKEFLEDLVQANAQYGRNIQSKSKHQGREKVRETNESSQKKERHCAFCNGDHYADQCTQVATLAERKQKIAADKRCLQCLRTGHVVKDCQGRQCFRCRGAHHAAICMRETGVRNQFLSGANTIPIKIVQLTTVGSTAGKQAMVSKVLVRAPDSNKKEKYVLMHLDTGAEATFIDTETAEKLGCVFESQQAVTIQPVGSRAKTIMAKKTAVDVIDRDGLPIRVFALAVRDLHSFFNASTQNEKTEKTAIVLSHHYLSMIGIRADECAPDGSGRLKSKIGDFWHGRPGEVELCGHATHVRRARLAEIYEVDELDEKDDSEYRKMYALENEFGIKEGMQDTDKEVFEQVVKSMTWDGERCSVALPWLDKNCQIEDNLGVTYGRTRSWLKNMTETEFDTFSAYLKDQVEAGVVEEVIDWTKTEGPRVHYLPVQAVYKTKEDGSLKLRLVNDGSSRSAKGLSLNDLLHKGPVILPCMQGMLLRFLTARWASVSDIEAAFLQVGIVPEDRDALRFIFAKDKDKPLSGSNVAVYRFRRLPFGITPASALLAIVLACWLEKRDISIKDEVIANVYVDNLILRGNTQEEVADKSRRVRDYLKEIGMNLRDFKSNAEKVYEQVTHEASASGKLIKVLGIYWDPEKDQILLKIPLWDGKTFSKKEAMSLVARLFDPLGLVQPMKVRWNIFLQKFWDQSSLQQELTGEARRRFEDIAADHDGSQIWLERPGKSLGSKWHLFVFTDASKYAAGIVAYGVAEDMSQVKRLLARSKVRPVFLRKAKKSGDQVELTVNLMELLGLDMGLSALQFLKQETTEILSENIYTDSACCLQWLRGTVPQKNQVFVRNRITRFVRECTAQVRHIPGAENPADIVSRGMSKKDLEANMLWQQGPKRLTNPTEWGEPIVLPRSIAVKRAIIENSEEIEKIFDELVRECDSFEIMLNQARKKMKLEIHHDEIAKLVMAADQSRHPPKEGQIEGMGLQVIDGIWKMKNRTALNMVGESEWLIFLSNESEILPKLVRDMHKNVHPDQVTTRAKLMRDFYFPGGRRTVRKSINNGCEECRKALALPCARPEFPALPEGRAKRCVPFEWTGIDLAGPFKVKSGKEGDKKDHKLWIALYTCLSVRAVYLDVMTGISTEDFMNSYRRFCAQHGTPKRVRSDQGVYFKLFAKVLAQMVSEEVDLQSEGNVQTKETLWEFTTQYAPWRGGMYERLVGTLKLNLTKSIRSKNLHYDTFWTYVKEIEAILNERPILSALVTEEGPMAIRPIDLINPLKGETWRPLSQERTEDDDDFCGGNTERVKKSWQLAMKKIDIFWDNFEKNYFVCLKKARSECQKYGPKVLEKGQIVLVEDESEPNRNFWKVAEVVDLVEGVDGVVRDARIRYSMYNRGRLAMRPLTHLFALEGQGHEHGEHPCRRYGGGPGDEEQSQPAEQSDEDRGREEQRKEAEDGHIDAGAVPTAPTGKGPATRPRVHDAGDGQLPPTTRSGGAEEGETEAVAGKRAGGGSGVAARRSQKSDL